MTLPISVLLPALPLLLALMQWKWNSRHKYKDHQAQLRKAFLGVVMEMETEQMGRDAYHLMHIHRSEHDDALAIFSGFVRRKDRSGFEAAHREFREARDALQPGILYYYERAVFAGHPVREANDVPRMIAAMRAVLAFTELGHGEFETMQARRR